MILVKGFDPFSALEIHFFLKIFLLHTENIFNAVYTRDQYCINVLLADVDRALRCILKEITNFCVTNRIDHS